MGDAASLGEQYAVLRAEHPAVQPSSYVLSAAICLIGRQSSCMVVVDHPSVSRQHARIERGEQGYLLFDIGSVNGTFVNGRRVRDQHPLRHSDSIGLGKLPSLLLFIDPNSTARSSDQLRYDDRFKLFYIRNRALELTPAQFRLLLHLYRNAGETCSRETCAQTIWGRDYEPGLDAAALEQAISSLRAKLRQHDPDSKLIRARRSEGYVLVLDD
jgi:hypothetical protein